MYVFHKERPTQESITMAVQQLAHVVMDADSINSSVNQMRANLNAISVILSNVASFVQNYSTNTTFDSTVRGQFMPIIVIILTEP